MSRFSSWCGLAFLLSLCSSTSFATLPVAVPRLDQSLSKAAANANFGEIEIGGTSVGSVQVCASCNSAQCVPPYLVVNSTEITGDAFQIEGTNCVGNTIPVGACCRVKVKMSPKTEGLQQGSVTFVTTGGNLTWSLSGVGVDGLPPDDSENSCIVPSHSYVSIDSLSLEEKIPLVGVPFHLSYSSKKFRSNFRLNVKKYGLGGWAPSLVHEYDSLREILYFGDGSSRSVSAREKDSELFATNSTGSEVYYFDSFGKHLRTRDGLTGVVIYSNSYDSAGRILSISDSYGNVTTFRYEGSSVEITSPYGQITQILLDENGWLKSVTNPNNEAYQVEATQTGFLTSFQKPGGQKSIVTYDADGFVTSDRGAGGDFIKLIRTFDKEARNQTVVKSTALNREMKFSTTAEGGIFKRTAMSSWGAKSTFETGNGVETSVDQYGLQFSSTSSSDPRFNGMVQYESQSRLSFPNQVIQVSRNRNVSATLLNEQDPFSFSLLRDVTTLQNDLDRVIVREYDPQHRKVVTLSAEKNLFTKLLNEFGQVSRLQVGNLAPLDLAYDERGRLIRISQGQRQSSMSYDARGNLNSFTDGLGRISHYEYDNANRLTRRSSPSGNSMSLSYDPNGNLIGVLPAGKKMHKFAYNLFEMVSEYMPPQVGSWIYGSTHYEYNLDQQLTSVTKPSRQKLLFKYDLKTGLLVEMDGEGEKYKLEYYGNSDLRKTLTSPSGQKTTMKYVGNVLSSIEQSGEVSGAISYQFNHLGLVSKLGVSDRWGGNAFAALSYDKDNRPTSYGGLNYQYNDNGLIKLMTLNSLNHQITYDSYGDKSADVVRSGSKELVRYSYSRDGKGRIVSEQEVMGKLTRRKDYGYDLDGRLTKVSINGRVAREYQFDANGNRTVAVIDGKKRIGTYNDLDMLLSYGASSYKYNSNGELIEINEKEGIFARKTKFGYDIFGNLRWALVPCGDRIEYVIDGQNRRIGKKVNGRLVQGFIYQSQTQIAAETDGSGRIVKRFFYGSKMNIPDSMIYKGKQYKIVSNQVGTPRLLIDSENGRVVEELEIDEFGANRNVEFRSLLPFGFAGGVYDQDTGLLKFGARDYEPITGRWTSKDPIGFNGGDANLYGYVANDPVNQFDPSGKFAVQLCIANSILDTTKLMGQLGAELDEANASKSSCSSKGRTSAQIQQELDSLNVFGSVYYKCLRPDLILPDQGT